MGKPLHSFLQYLLPNESVSAFNLQLLPLMHTELALDENCAAAYACGMFGRFQCVPASVLPHDILSNPFPAAGAFSRPAWA
ncbi:MAG: hypothetical protein GX548_09315 [Lentisphaerae bacterium]|nr:hypothetical protein [Lentisphaerota bacterium]